MGSTWRSPLRFEGNLERAFRCIAGLSDQMEFLFSGSSVPTKLGHLNQPKIPVCNRNSCASLFCNVTNYMPWCAFKQGYDLISVGTSRSSHNPGNTKLRLRAFKNRAGALSSRGIPKSYQSENMSCTLTTLFFYFFINSENSSFPLRSSI